ncbi:unnamed protein product [Prunus armeniaca]
MYTIWATRPLAIDCLISFLCEPRNCSPSHLKHLRASSPIAEPSPSWPLSLSILPCYIAAVPFTQPLWSSYLRGSDTAAHLFRCNSATYLP